jgi:anti-sigma regulatory factor (Ser/Thr protein kinase)
MPLNLRALPLASHPEAVHEARAWVRDVLEQLDRKDIIDAAELGVSELVTNAILHGAPPISVRVRGTRKHPRVEVRDGSKRPPQVQLDMTHEHRLMATFGRGLGLLALNSLAWGAELVPDGKVVWFEPADAPRRGGDLSGEVFDLDQTVQERIAATGRLDDPVRVRLLDLPVALYARFRRRYQELGRELRLLSLAHRATYPVATDLAEAFLQAEQERRLTRGAEQLEQLLSSSAERADIELQVPRSAAATSLRLLETLERADEFCREQRLLVLAATPLELELQRWYLGEFARQAAGEEPRPWPGPFEAAEGPPPARP